MVVLKKMCETYIKELGRHIGQISIVCCSRSRLLLMSARNCQSFVNFCNRAKSSIQTGGATDDNQAMVKCGEAVACAIKGTISELSGHTIACSYSGFPIADLILFSLIEVKCVIIYVVNM